VTLFTHPHVLNCQVYVSFPPHPSTTSRKAQARQRWEWGWAIVPIPMKGSFFLLKLYIFILTPFLPSPAVPPLPIRHPEASLQPNTKTHPHMDAFLCVVAFPPHQTATMCPFGHVVGVWDPSTLPNTSYVPKWVCCWCLVPFHPTEHLWHAHLGALLVFSTHLIHPPARHKNTSHMGRVFMSGWIYSTRTPWTCPFGHIHGVRQVLHPSLWADMWGAFHVCLPPSPPETTNVPTWAHWCPIRAPKPAVWVCYGLRMEGTFPIIETRHFGHPFYFANEMCRFRHVLPFTGQWPMEFSGTVSTCHSTRHSMVTDPQTFSDPRHHLYATLGISGLLRNSQWLPLFLPQLPAVWQLHPTIFFWQPSFFFLSHPLKRKVAATTPIPLLSQHPRPSALLRFLPNSLPTHPAPSGVLVLFSERELKQDMEHFWLWLLLQPSTTFRTFHASSAPFPYTLRTRTSLRSHPTPYCSNLYLIPSPT